MSDDLAGDELTFPGSVCFGCSATNPVALGLRFFRQDGEILTRYRAHAHHCGAPGVVHGGILATIIDEVSCAAVVAAHGTHVVTGELTVRYLAACPVEREIEVRARITETRPRYFVVTSEVRLDGAEIARSSGRFFPAPQRAESAP